MQHLFALGLNHRYAAVEFRERLAFGRQELPTVLGELRQNLGLTESVVLATCNRVEVYGVAEDLANIRRVLPEFLSLYRAVDEASLRKTLYFFDDEEVVRHLFRVATGLDSMVVGESEILGQVKEAYRVASQEGHVKALLHHLFERAFRAAKRARQETGIASGAVSVASVAVELAQKIFGRLAQENILLLGTGKVSELTLKRLVRLEARAIWIASRNPDRAQELARKYDVRPVLFSDWRHYLREADIVISSTASPHPIVRYEDVKEVMALRKHKPLFIIDLAVPRDTEERVNSLDDVYLYNIDDLTGISEANVKLRRKEIAKCEAIIEKEVEHFLHWLRQLDSSAIVEKLQARLQAIIREELEVAAKTESPERVEVLRRMLARVKGKLLHEPLRKLKEVQEEGGGHHYFEALQTLFDLERVQLNHEENKVSDREPGKQTGAFAD